MMETLLRIAGAGGLLWMVCGFVVGLWFPAIETPILAPIAVVTLTSLGLAGAIWVKRGNLRSTRWFPKEEPDRGVTIGFFFFLFGLALGGYLWRR